MKPEVLRGVELARRFYAEAVQPLLGSRTHAAARLGPGSDVLGFDTERSTDHGWGPRLAVFVAASDVEATRAAIDAGLPDTLCGWPVRFGWDDVAEKHHVEISTLETWLTAQLGFDPSQGIATRDWLLTPQQLLLEVTAGAVFADPEGHLTSIRERLAWYPDDVWLYLLACQWGRIAQEEAFVGRTAEVGDELGSRILTARLVRDLMRLGFLLEKRYAPYAKWLGSAFHGLPVAAELAPALTAALEASDIRTREAGLCRAYECVARRHNQLGLTDAVDPSVRGFYGRPYRVIGGDRFAASCGARIGDAWLKRQPPVGGIDQFADSTDVLSYPAPARALASIYVD